jgi:CheY-like chemotaxis protein
MYSKGIGHGCTFTMELPILSTTVSTIIDNHQIPNRDEESLYDTHHIYNNEFIREQESNEIFDLRHPSISTRISINETTKDVIHFGNRRRMSQSMRVLVVDDVAMNRTMLIRCMKYKYPLISEAEDGVIAVNAVVDAHLKGQPYDIILLDYEMPNMTGPIAAKTMRNNGYTGIIIGVTGNGLQSDITYFLSHGADRVLIKPVNTDKLDLCIEGIVKYL